MPDDKQKSLFSVPGEKPISQFEITNPIQPSFRDLEIQRQRYLDSIYYNMPSVISSGFELMPEERRKVLFQTSTAPQDNLIPTEENKKKVHYTPEEIKAKEVQQRGTESPIAQSLMSILPGGIAQNLEFMLGTNTLSGGELLTDSNRYRLSKEEVQKLRETNLLTDEEVENYLKNQEDWGSLELVRGIGQGLINSLLIGVETAVTGGGNLQFKLGEFGSKMFTKEALKFATKQSLQQGIATLKAASIGTIIRAGDGIKQDLAEIEKQGKPVETLDVIGSILKNTAVETALTASEGITEGLVRDMKLAPLGKGWTETLSGWKQFAKNVGKKTFSSLFVETGTEQLTDIITDVTKGEQSAFWNIWTGDTPEVRKQALNNLITEAAIGLLLGNIYGIKDVTKGSTERYIAEAVNRKEITEEDGQRLLAMMDDIDVNKIKETAVNLNNYLKAKELIDNTPELKAVASVIESINDKTLPNTDDQINILTSAEVALKAKEKSNKKQGNTLDLAIEAGIQYVDSQITAGLEASKGEITPEIQALKTVRDNLSTMDFNLMHSYTESIRKNVVKVLSKSTDPNIKNALQTLADNKISLDDVSDYIALKSLGTADIFASKALEKFKNLEFKDVVPTLDYLKDQLPKDALLFMPNAVFADHMQKLKGLSQVLQVLSDNLKNPSKPQNKELFSAVPFKPGLDRVEADTGFDPHFNSFARYLRSESKRWVHNNPEEWTEIVNEHINSDIKDELSQFGISIVDIANADTDYLDNLARHIQEAKSVNPEISDESTAKIIDALSRIKQDVYLQVHDIAQELNEAMPTLVPKGDVTPELVTEIYKQIRNRFLDNLSKDANRNDLSTEEIQKQIDEKEALLSGILEGLEAYIGKPIQVMLDEIALPSNIITELNIPLKPVIYDVMLNSTGLIDPNMLQEMKTYGDLLADVPEITTIGDLIDHFIEKKLMPEELIPFAKILKAAVGDIYVHITDLGANERSIAQAATAIVESLLTEEVDTTTETSDKTADLVQTTTPTITFETTTSSNYQDRTKINASADATIAFAVNFKTPGEKLTKEAVKNQGKLYIPIDASNLNQLLNITQARVDKVVETLNSLNKEEITLNIAGNGLSSLGKYTQEQVDQFAYSFLKKIISSPNLKVKITSIRTGGQTGFDEAGAKAGIRLGIPVTVLAPAGWRMRLASGRDIYDEQAFKNRFNITQPINAPIVKENGIYKFKEPVVIFTDGSDRGKGKDGRKFLGYGIATKVGNKIYEMSSGELDFFSEQGQKTFKAIQEHLGITPSPEDEISNPVMELWGAYRALSKFQNSNAHITIYADYLGVTHWFDGTWKAKNPYIKAILAKIKEIEKQIVANGGSITIKHVKGHSGVSLNERVDYLAKSPSRIDTINLEQMVKDSISLKSEGKRVIYGKFLSKDGRRIIQLNKQAPITEGYDPVISLLHEAIHAYTADWLESEDAVAREFRSKLMGLKSQVARGLSTSGKEQGYWLGTLEELREAKQKYADEIASVLENESTGIHELLALLSNPGFVKDVLRKISALADRPAKVNNIWETIKGFFKQLYIRVFNLDIKTDSPTTVAEALLDLISDYSTDLEAYHISRKAAFKISADEAKLIKQLNKLALANDTPEEIAAANAELGDKPLDQLEYDTNEATADTDEDMLKDLSNIKSTEDILLSLGKFADKKEFSAHIHLMGTFENFLTWINELNGKQALDSHLQHLYKTQYKQKYFRDPEGFRESYLKRLYLKHKEQVFRPHIIIKNDTKINPDTNETEKIVNLEVQPGKFIYGDGSIGDGYVAVKRLDELVSKLGTLFPKKAFLPFKLMYLAGIEDYNLGTFIKRTSINKYITLEESLATAGEVKKLTNIMFNGDKKDYRYIFLGNYGGRSTNPVIAIPKTITDNPHFRESVNKFLEHLWNSFVQTLPDTLSQQEIDDYKKDLFPSTYAEGLQYIFRMLTHEAWFNPELLKAILPTDEELSQSEQEINFIDKWLEYIKSRQEKGQSIFAMGDDFNKVMKRGMALLTDQTHNLATDPHTLNRRKALPTGFTIQNGQVHFRIGVIDSRAKGNIEVKLADNSVEIVDISKLLLNTIDEGLETTDGAIFVLANEFEDYYYDIFGVLKDGTIKAVYSSKIGEEPVYLKFAIHVVPKNSPLGQVMLKGNLAMLASDTAVKVGLKNVQKINIADVSKVDVSATQISPDMVATLPLNNLQRIKEELGTNTKGGTIKQITNASGLTKNSQLLKQLNIEQDITKALDYLASRAIDNALKEYEASTTQTSLMNYLVDIIHNPVNQQELLVSKMLQFLPALSEDDRLQYIHLTQHPTIAAAIRNRLMRILNAGVQNRIAGMRMTLGPDIGLLAPDSNVNPVINKWNIRNWITNLDINDVTFVKLVPQKWLREGIKKYQNLQRKEARMHTDRSYGDLMEDGRKQSDYIKEEKLQVLEELKAKAAISKDLMDWQIEAINNENIYDVINMQHPAFKDFADKIKSQVFQEGYRLKGRYTIISEDFAKKYGLRPGDRVFAVITPTDSGLGGIPLIVAGIAPVFADSKNPERKSIDRMKIVVNSELIQSLLGKDYDIDTISVMPFHPEYWTEDLFNKFLNAMEKLHDNMPQALSKVIDATIGKPNRPVSSIFDNAQRVRFMQSRLGAKMLLGDNADPLVNMQYQSPIISMYNLLIEYAKNDIGQIVYARLVKDAMNAIGFKIKRFGEVFTMNHDNAIADEAMLNIATNHFVDWPGKTDKLYYNNNTDNIREALWSKNDVDIERMAMNAGVNPDVISRSIAVLNSLTSNLVLPAFRLASGLDLQGNNLTLVTFIETVKHQQTILRLLQSTSYNDRAKLTKILVGPRFDSMNSNTQKRYTELVHSMQVDNVLNYPLFKTIMSIPVDSLQIPGSMYEDWLIDQVEVGRTLLAQSPVLYKIMYERILPGALPDSKHSTAVFFKKTDKLEKHFAWRFYNIVSRRRFVTSQVDTYLNLAMSTWSKEHRNAFTKIPREDVKARIEFLENTIASPTVGSRFAKLDAKKKTTLLDTVIYAVQETDFDRASFALQEMMTAYYEYVAARSWTNVPYSSEFLRNNKPVSVNIRAIGLSMLPSSLDFYSNRIDKLQSLAMIQSATAVAYFGQQESANTTSGKTSQRLDKARAVAYPVLLAKLAERGAPDSKPMTLTVSTPQGLERITLQIKDGKFFVTTADQKSTIQISPLKRTAKFSDAAIDPKMREHSPVTYYSTLLFTPNHFWFNKNNRLVISNNIDFLHNLLPSERLQVMEDILRDNLYNPDIPYSRVDREAFWLASLAQGTDYGEFNNTIVNFINNKTLFDPNKPMDYKSNELAWYLLAKFEPSLGKLLFKTYSQIASTERLPNDLPISNNINSFHNSINDNGIVLYSTRRAPGINSLSYATNFVSDELQGILLRGLQDEGYRTLVKLYKEKGYEAAAKFVAEKATRSIIYTELSKLGFNPKQLAKDILRLSQNELNEKYGNGVQSILEYLEKELSHDDNPKVVAGKLFVEQKVATKSKTIGGLVEAYFALKAVEQAASRTAEAASTMWKKLGRDIKHSQLPYDVWGVLKEHKIYGYGNPVDHNEPIDIAFDINPKYGLSIKEITIEDVKMFNNYYATSPIKLVGLSSIALYKQQYLVRSINRIQSDLADSVKLVTEFVNLVYDKNAKTDLGAKITSGAIQDPSIKLLKSLLDQADLRVITKTFPDEAAYTEYIFNLAENLTAQTDIKVKRTSEGKLAYIYKDKTYNSITALMDNYPAHPGKKLSIMIALQFRDLYDVKVPTLLIRALGYLAKIKEELVDLDDLYNISIIDALIDKYESYLSAINRKQGSYMPHMYSREQLSVDYIGERGSSIYQDLLKDIKNAKAGLIKDKGLAEIDLSDLDVITSGYDDNPEALRQLKASNPSAYAKISKAITTKAKVQKILNRRIVRSLRSSEANSDLTYVIGNLLPRTSKNPDYIKSTSEPHYRYISTLVFGVKNDLLLADYIMYDSKARATGENPEMRELTKRWYAEQANNKFFHTKGISTSDLKRGDEIVFFTHGMQYDPQTDTEVFRKFAHAGIVESVDHEKKTFTLKVDKAEAKAQIQRRIGKLATLLNKMIQSDNPTPISMDTIRELKQLVADGYLKAGLLSKNTTEAQGLRLLLTGYNNKLKYMPQSNVFSFADVSFRDAMGPDQDEYVGLYHLDGALEYFTNLKNRYKNLRNKYGVYENKLDATLYHLFSGLETLTHTSNIVKNMIVLSFMGTVNAAKALTTNTVGAILSNILDAPVSYTRYAKAGRQLWRSFKGKKTYEMTEDQRNFYNIFVSLGLINTRDLKTISLEAANLDAIAMLSENGFLQSIRTLALALYHGGEYRKHIDRIAKYRQLSIMSTGLESIQYSRKVLQEQAKWKAYLNNLISKKEYKSDDPAMTSKAEKALAQRSTKTIRTSNKSNSMTDLEVPGLAAKFIWKSFFTGPLGIGLQSIGEFLRRPAFFSGYYQALDLGYTHDQAVQFGINNIEMRHAFYGKANRVMGANRRLGKLSKLYVQYTMNNMLKTFINFKRAIIQFISQKNTEVIDNNKNRAKAIVTSVFRKSIDLVDAQGQTIKNEQNITLGEVNIARRLMLQTTLAMMIAQMGNTVFYGVQNMVPPVYQFLYDTIRLALETIGLGPDDDDGDDGETTKNELLWVLQETLFWLGVPFKIAIQEASKNPDDQGTINGRLKDAMEVLDRTYNTFSYAFGDSETKAELEENKAKQLKDVSFVIDKMLFGIKLTGWQPANDLYGEYTGERWVWQDPFSEDAKFPYIAGREEGLIRKRMRTRTVLENLDASGIQQSIGGPGQELERLILLTRINNFLRASIPYFDLVNPVDVAE